MLPDLARFPAQTGKTVARFGGKSLDRIMLTGNNIMLADDSETLASYIWVAIPKDKFKDNEL